MKTETQIKLVKYGWWCLLAALAIIFASSAFSGEVYYDEGRTRIRMYRGYKYLVYKSYDQLIWEKDSEYDLPADIPLPYIEALKAPGAYYGFVKFGTGSWAPTEYEFAEMGRGTRLNLPWTFVNDRVFVDRQHYGNYFYRKTGPNTAELVMLYSDGAIYQLSLSFTGRHTGVYRNTISYRGTPRGMVTGSF